MVESMADKSTTHIEKRLSGRAKMSQMMRVRPSDPEDEHFEELPITINVSKQGLYFHTHRTDYRKGMRLFVTYPFTFAGDPTRAEYLAEVVRVEQLQDKRIGVAVRLLTTI
jgi:PilZ domain-containing protein